MVLRCRGGKFLYLEPVVPAGAFDDDFFHGIILG